MAEYAAGLRKGIREMKKMIAAGQGNEAGQVSPSGGLAQWLIDRFRRVPGTGPRLAMLERISLAPRQSLALIEADGRRLLVATSPQAAPAFFVLDGPDFPVQSEPQGQLTRYPGRISW